MLAAVKNVDWQQFGKDLKTFGKRFAASDFAHITPEVHEQNAVAAFFPRMAALVVWRRALLTLASILTLILVIKSCFDPHTLSSQVEQKTVETQRKLQPKATADEIKAIKEGAKADAEQTVKALGESNVGVINGLMIGLWISVMASLVFQAMAAREWRNWRRSRKLSLIALGALLIPQLLAMLIPWSAMMDFKHLEAAAGDPAQMAGMKMGIQMMVLLVVLMNAMPFFYGLFNGVLRASLSTKTLVPASIVCGWGSMLLAITISVPWFIVLSIVDQFQADILFFTGVVCLLAAPLSIVLRSRRLGMPLTPEEATPLVRKAKFLLTGLNVAGVILLLVYFGEKDLVNASQITTLVIHYFANLLLVQVVAVDMLALLLHRAHRKLAADTAPGEPLRQLSEVLVQ